MRNLLCIVAILLCVVVFVEGHAALVTPRPWWWAASRDRPCGFGNFTSIPKAIWPVGSNQSILWWVIAGDGTGEVHVRLNLDGSNDFSTNATQWLTVKQPIIASTGYFNLSTIVPNVKCRGPNNTCTVQFRTDSGGGWYSCTTVSIVCNGCQGGTPISRDECVTAGTLPFCSAKSGKQVMVPDDQTAGNIDALTRDTFNLNQKNPNVFTNGNSSACITAYQTMLCELYLTPCGNSSSSYTKQMCQQALSTCGLTANHSQIYNCSVFPSAPSTTTSITVGTTSTTTKSTTTTTTTTTTAKSTTITTAKSSSTTSKASLVAPDADGAYFVDDVINSSPPQFGNSHDVHLYLLFIVLYIFVMYVM